MDYLIYVLVVARILVPIAITLGLANRVQAWDLRRAV
jgi:hypothetical protein